MRCIKFYAVGSIGMAVHLGLLTLFVRVFGMHYQLATVLSVEAAVLHNFLWHLRWTWADRPVRGAAATARRLLRFNLTNGLNSLLGNVVFMQLFAGRLGLDPLLSALLSIPPCALLNFLVSDRWVFLAAVASPCSVHHNETCHDLE